MKNHIWRPLLVVIALVLAILIVRAIVVPDDFGVHEAGYMYGWYREGNIEEWKDFKVKYQGSAYCAGCHVDKVEDRERSRHGFIECENCHGPAIDHPEDPPALNIDTSRELCIRCHSWLPYPTSDRSSIPGIDPATHNPDMECVMCHDPHHPNLEDM